jgi:signal transduction histidine kinase
VALARDMHDLVAHSLSLMVVQAGAARMVSATDQQAAQHAVGVVLDTGQQAMGELDELLSVLRGDTTMPTRSSSRPNVEELVGQARQAGLDVALQSVGSEPVAAGSTLELFEYRLVQEALTNVRKHAPDARVHVRLQHDPGSVVIHVENTPPAATPGALVTLGAGHGLLGMRERVALLGGQLQAEPTQTGGFAVRAVMPRELVET